MNASQWRVELEQLYQGLKSGSIKPPVACEMNNTIGKVINLTKLELEYYRLVQQHGDKAPKIPLLLQSKEIEESITKNASAKS